MKAPCLDPVSLSGSLVSLSWVAESQAYSTRRRIVGW